MTLPEKENTRESHDLTADIRKELEDLLEQARRVGRWSVFKFLGRWYRKINRR